jgi:hypothetical protein
MRQEVGHIAITLRMWPSRRRALIVAVAALAASPATAVAATKPDPAQLILDGFHGVLVAQTEPRVCPELSAGTAGLPEITTPGRDTPDHGNGLAPGDETTAPAALPKALYLRSTTATYNRRYWFVLSGGHIYFKSNAEVTGIHQPWAPLPTPGCFDGTVTGISVDDDELIAIADDRQIFTMDGALGDPSFFDWTVRWGPAFWTGAGRRLPHGKTFSWSVSSPIEDGTFTDPAGNRHPVGDAKVSHVWLLSHHGQWLTYMDPWLPADRSYEMCGPKRGRFRSVDMSASGSTEFVINRFGDMFTRLYDFDISGPDSFFVNYSYANQRGRANPAVQLPPEPWKRQPKIPGRITSAISIEKKGKGSIHRILRVEGTRNGHTGYWQRDSAAARSVPWRFVRTDAKLTGHPIRNLPGNTSRRGFGPSEDRRYSSRHATIPNFNAYCSPARMRFHLGHGKQVALRLHSTDEIRQTPRARGLNSHPRKLEGTIQASPRVLHSRNPRIRRFVARHLTGRFTDAPIEATRRALRLPNQNWTFRHPQ